MREQRAQGRRQGESRAGGVFRPVVDVLFHQGADGDATVRAPAPWRPLAPGVVVLLGGVAATVLGVIGTELVNVLLAAGITLVAAGLVDGTGGRVRGAGTGLVMSPSAPS